MRIIHANPWIPGLFTLAAMAGQPAQAGNFVYTTIDVPGASATYPGSINDQGVVAGAYTTSPTSAQSGFIWSNGAITTFTRPHPSRSIGVAGIDDRGSVAFSAGGIRGGGSQAAVRHPDGHVTRVPTPADALGWSSAVNGLGQIVGGYESSPGSADRTGFLFKDGQFQTLAFPGAALTTPTGIAKNGTVIGSYSAGDADGAHGFVYRNGSYQSFDPPKSTYTMVNSINARGDIAGTIYTAQLGTGTLGYVFSGGKYHIYALRRGKEYVNEVTWAGSASYVAGNFYNLVNEIAFTHVSGQYYQLLPFGAANSYVYAGNRQGTLVGNYWGSDGVMHGFVAVCPSGQAPCSN